MTWLFVAVSVAFIAVKVWETRYLKSLRADDLDGAAEQMMKMSDMHASRPGHGYYADRAKMLRAEAAAIRKRWFL